MVFDHIVTADLVQDAEILSCVETLLRDARFPPLPGGRISVSYPFYFGARPTEDGC